jgi:hypothetical protein
MFSRYLFLYQSHALYRLQYDSSIYRNKTCPFDLRKKLNHGGDGIWWPAKAKVATAWADSEPSHLERSKRPPICRHKAVKRLQTNMLPLNHFRIENKIKQGKQNCCKQCITVYRT